MIDDPVVTYRENCGNLVLGVALFALERGMVAAPASDMAES